MKIEHNINNSIFTTTYENGKHYFPTLYKRNSNGKVSFWNIYVEDDSYYRESGIIGGKIREYDPVVNCPKNVGRSNETTAEDQALFKSNSLWKLKKDELYTEQNPDEEVLDLIEDYSKTIRPMLANKFNDYPVKYPVGVSPKLDGIRAMIYMDKSGEIRIMSRYGKEFSGFDNIRNEAKKIINNNIKLILDGELYSHDIGFNAISGAVRSLKETPYHNKIKFYMFDFVHLDIAQPYTERVRDMIAINEIFKFIDFISYEIACNKQDVLDAHNKYVQKGYEGVIVRKLDSPYSLGKRSNNLLKYKEFEDAEFKIVDVIESTGEKGAAIFVCVTTEGKQFTVRPRGSIETRKEQFANKLNYIGKLLTVRSQALVNEEGLPRFPVGIDVRDYE